MARLQTKYKEEIIPKLKEKFGFSNDLRVPRLEKIVINMGVGEGVGDSRAVQAALEDLALIAGQKPQITKSRKSIANFKLRAGMAVGGRVTLRGRMMYEFLDRLISVGLPRIRDFRGLPGKLDGRGNYTMGLAEQSVFPEVDIDKVYRVQGMDITIVTTADSDEEAKELLFLFGLPFADRRLND